MLRRWTLAILPVACVVTLAGCSSAPNASPSGDRTSLAIQFVQSMTGGKYADATKQFNGTMSQAMSADQLKAAWSTLIGQCGAFKRLGGTRTGKEGGFEEVFVAVECEKTTFDVKVVFDKDNKIGGLWFVPHVAAGEAQYTPPAYAQKGSFDESEVTVGSGEWKLPGTLTIPKGDGPFPAVVLVHGSGPEDRDETIGPNKPFKDIAWGLASRGVAVLRYEKRSKVYTDPAKWGKSFTVKEEVIDDALAAVYLLRNSKKIDPKRIFVLGHSNGGLLSPRIGKADPEITGLIMMAGCLTQPLEAVFLRQLTYIASLNGPMTDEAKKEMAQYEQQIAIVKSLKPSTKSSASLTLGGPASYWLDIQGYVPAEMAKSLKQPMLIMQGGRDYQVTEVDFKIWKATLSSRTNVTFKLYPDLNHLFMTGVGKATPAEYAIPGSVAQTVIDDITSWIGDQ